MPECTKYKQTKQDSSGNIVHREGYLAKGIATNTRDNRSRFVEFAKTQEMAVINTIITKPPHKRVTYKEKVPQHNPDKEEYQGEDSGPYDHTKYAQCDYWLVDKTHQCTFKDCESKIEWARDSDHYPLWAKIQINKKKEENNKHKDQKGTAKYWKPEQAQGEEYNRRVWEILIEQHQKEWEDIKQRNEEEEPESPFTLDMTAEEERTRELLARYGHICPQTPSDTRSKTGLSAQLLNDALADKWETRRTGIYRSEEVPEHRIQTESLNHTRPTQTYMKQ